MAIEKDTLETASGRTEAAPTSVQQISSAIVWIRQQRPALKRSRVLAGAGGPNAFEEAHHALRYLVGPRPDCIVRHCPDHLDWSRSGCPRTSMAGLRVPTLT